MLSSSRPPGVRAPAPLLLQAHVLRRAGARVAPDDVDARLLGPRAAAPGERQLVDGHVHHAIDQRLLDLVEERLAPLRIGLARLALEEVLDLRQRARGVDPALADV